MDEPSRHNRLCSLSRNVSETIDKVKNLIETCIYKYMSLEETVTYLEDNHKISHHLTITIWEQLQKESPEFFKKYYFHCELARQIEMFNIFLGKQVSLMVENGDLDIGTAPFKNFLGQDPEGAHLLVKLANTPFDRSEMSPSSLATLALDDTPGLTVNKLQIPNDQQNQFHSYQWSTTTNHIPLNQLPIPNGQQNHLHQNQWSTRNHQACTLGAPTVQPAANDQTFFSIGTNLGAPTAPPGANDHWFPYSDPTCTNLGAPAVPPEANSQWLPYTDHAYNYPVVYSTGAPAVTAQWPTSNDFLPIDIGAPTFAKAPIAAFDHFANGFGKDINNSSPNFQPMDPSTAKLLTLLDHLQQDPYG
ncbi:putative angiotensin-converting enzyme 2 [Arabidopsis thaliana]